MLFVIKSIDLRPWGMPNQERARQPLPLSMASSKTSSLTEVRRTISDHYRQIGKTDPLIRASIRINPAIISGLSRCESKMSINDEANLAESPPCRVLMMDESVLPPSPRSRDRLPDSLTMLIMRSEATVRATGNEAIHLLSRLSLSPNTLVMVNHTKATCEWKKDPTMQERYLKGTNPTMQHDTW